MASYSDKTYTFDGLEVQYGLGLAFNMAGKYPAITKRIFDTKAMAQAFIDDKDDSAVVGLTLTVIADSTENNGVYFVKSIGDGTNPGVLEKLGTSKSAGDINEAVIALQDAVGASGSTEFTKAISGDTYASGATSVAAAVNKLDAALKAVEEELKEAESVVKGDRVTAATFNNVAATITSGADGTSIAVSANGDDIKVASSYTEVTYDETFSGTGVQKVAATDNVSAAFGKVESTIAQLVSDVVANEETTTQSVKAIKEAVGLDENLGYSAETSANYISDASSVQDALVKLDSAIKTSQDEQTKYTVSALTQAEIDALEGHANIKEAYHLLAVDKDGGETATGEVIKIYKDSSLSGVTYSDQKLHFVYIKADGTSEEVDVDLTELITEQEFGSGITVTDHVAHGVVDATSEEFLTVGADGFKLAGVQTAIDNAAASATTVVATGATADGHVTVSEETVDGHKKYTVTTSDIASASALTQEIADRTSGDTALQNQIKELSGKTLSSVTGTGINLELQENNTKLSAYTDGTLVALGDAIVSGEGQTFLDKDVTIKGAIQSVVNEIIDNEKVEAAAISAIKTSVGLDENLAYKPSEDDTYVSADDTITSAIDKLDAAIKNTKGDSISGVVVNSVTATVTNNVASVTIDGADVVLDGYAKGTDSGAVATTDTVNAAIGKLENQIQAANDSADAAIKALDVEAIGETGKFIRYVEEADGKISASADTVAASEVSYDKTDDKVITAATNVSAALKELDSAVDASTKAQKEYKIVSADTASLGENVKEAYKIQVKDGNATEYSDVADSSIIKIYKDSSLAKVELVTKDDKEYLEFTYNTASGGTSVVDIDVSKFLSEAEFKDGLELGDASGSGNTVHVKLDATADSDSAKFLYMKAGVDGANGSIALSGITDAINAASAASKTVVSGTEGVVAEKTPAAEDGHVEYVITADGSTIKTAAAVLSGEGSTDVVIASGTSIDAALQTIVNNIIDNEEVDAQAVKAIKESVGLDENLVYTPASTDKYISGETTVSGALDALDKAIQDATKAAVEGLDKEDTAVANQYVTAVSEEDGIISVSRKQIGAEEISATTIASSTTSVAVTGDTVAAQIASLAQSEKANTVTNTDNSLTLTPSDNGTVASVKFADAAEDNANDMISVGENGIVLSDTWDCGSY